MTKTDQKAKTLHGLAGAPKSAVELALFLDEKIGPENWTNQYRPVGDGSYICTLTVGGVSRDGIGSAAGALYEAARMHGLTPAPPQPAPKKEPEIPADPLTLAEAPKELKEQIADEAAKDPTPSNPSKLTPDVAGMPKNEEPELDVFGEAASVSDGQVPPGYVPAEPKRAEKTETAVTDALAEARKADPVEAKQAMEDHVCEVCGSIIPRGYANECLEKGLPMIHSRASCQALYKQQKAKGQAA